MLSGFHVFIKENTPENVDLEEVFSRVNMLMPEHLLQLIDVVYIGHFKIFDDRNINATQINGALYISNDQDSNADMIDDIVHEIAHSAEQKYRYLIYDDDSIKNEYFGKLKRLKNFLAFEGYDIRDVNFFNEKYNQEFDDFLHKKVGYDNLKPLIRDLFLDPYSCTSMQEYFSSCFEKFVLTGNHDLLKDLCPYVYKKIYLLFNYNMEDDEL